MCGYCTESAALAQLLVEMTHGPFPHESLIHPIYLQEVANWGRELASWDGSDPPRGAMLALCRQWSERIADRSPPPLAGGLHAEACGALHDGRAELASRSQEQDKDVPPLPRAQADLDAYIAGWLQPTDVNAWDQEALQERFLEVSIALDVVAKSAPDDARLETLALVAPGQVPFFDALDLWLQRRALQACVAHHGVAFIKEHQAALRFEAVLALVLRDLLAKTDLLALQAAMQDASMVPFNFQADAVLDAIQAKLLRLAIDLSQSCGRAISGPYQSGRHGLFGASAIPATH